MRKNMSDQKLPLCIKLDRMTRDDFKRITHEKGTTMQNTLKAFVSYYILNSDQFTVQNSSSIIINEEVPDGTI
jgi:hypothetical protein